MTVETDSMTVQSDSMIAETASMAVLGVSMVVEHASLSVSDDVMAALYASMAASGASMAALHASLSVLGRAAISLSDAAASLDASLTSPSRSMISSGASAAYSGRSMNSDNRTPADLEGAPAQQRSAKASVNGKWVDRSFSRTPTGENAGAFIKDPVLLGAHIFNHIKQVRVELGKLLGNAFHLLAFDDGFDNVDLIHGAGSMHQSSSMSALLQQPDHVQTVLVGIDTAQYDTESNALFDEDADKVAGGIPRRIRQISGHVVGSRENLGDDNDPNEHFEESDQRSLVTFTFRNEDNTQRPQCHIDNPTEENHQGQ